MRLSVFLERIKGEKSVICEDGFGNTFVELSWLRKHGLILLDSTNSIFKKKYCQKWSNHTHKLVFQYSPTTNQQFILIFPAVDPHLPCNTSLTAIFIA